MSSNTFKIRNLLSKKFILLVSLILISSINNISCLNYNRGPLEQSHPSNVDGNNNIDDDDEFTGNTYIEPTVEATEHNGDSLLELENEISDENYEDEDDTDDDEEYDDEDEDIDVDSDNKNKNEDSDEYLDRTIDSSLLEMENGLFGSSTNGLNESEELDDGTKINSKFLNDNKLKEYLKKLGAIDKMRSAKNKGREAISSIKSKINSIPENYRKLKGKINPSKLYNSKGSNTSGEHKVDHRRRLLNTMNDVDERRRDRENNRNDEDTHSNSNTENKVNHRRRLFNTMNDVDERRKRKEESRIGEIKRRFRRNN